MATLAQINARIAKAHPHIELVRGEGYHYFIFDNGTAYDTRSVMVPYTSHMTAARWLEEAAAFAADAAASLADAAAEVQVIEMEGMAVALMPGMAKGADIMFDTIAYRGFTIGLPERDDLGRGQADAQGRYVGGFTAMSDDLPADGDYLILAADTLPLMAAAIDATIAGTPLPAGARRA